MWQWAAWPQRPWLPARGVLSSATPAGASPAPAGAATVAGPPVSGWWREGGTGPLYWTSYGYSETTNTQIPESVWKANVDWVAGTFASHGYKMVCTDGWIDGTQKVTSHGYIRSLSDDWAHDWQWWVRYLHDRGMTLGVYYNPLWATRSAIEDRSVTVAGRSDVGVGDIVDAGNHFDTGDISWIDVDRDGAEEYVKGYVDYFRQMGVAFLRIDFLSWYETGFDQSEGTVCTAHGREGYLRALRWMREAAGPMKLSFVMPNLFDHASGERLYGDLVRIDNDASFGTWYNLSGGASLAADLVAVEQPLPGLHRLLGRVRSGAAHPRRRPLDPAVVRQRHRAADRGQPLHDGGGSHRHRRPLRQH